MFRAPRKILRGRGDLRGAHPQRLAGRGDVGQRLAQAVDRGIVVLADLLIAARERGLDAGGQLPLGHAPQAVGKRRDHLGLVLLHHSALRVESLTLQFGLRDVGCELDHLERLAALVEHGVVGRLDPDLAPAAADPPELGGEVFAAVQGRPELPVLGAPGVRRGHEDAVVPALHLRQGIAHRGQEVLVGGDDRTVQLELDHRLGAMDRGHDRLPLERVFRCPVPPVAAQPKHRMSPLE